MNLAVLQKHTLCVGILLCGQAGLTVLHGTHRVGCLINERSVLDGGAGNLRCRIAARAARSVGVLGLV